MEGSKSDCSYLLSTSSDINAKRAKLREFVLSHSASDRSSESVNITATSDKRTEPSPHAGHSPGKKVVKKRQSSGRELLRRIEAEEGFKSSEPIPAPSCSKTLPGFTKTDLKCDERNRNPNLRRGFSVEEHIYGKKISANHSVSESFQDRVLQLESDFVIKPPLDLPSYAKTETSSFSKSQIGESETETKRQTTDALKTSARNKDGALKTVADKKRLFEKMSDESVTEEIPGVSNTDHMDSLASSQPLVTDISPHVDETSSFSRVLPNTARSAETIAHSDLRSSLDSGLDTQDNTDTGFRQEISPRYAASQNDLDRAAMFSSSPRAASAPMLPQSSHDSPLFSSTSGLNRRPGSSTSDLRSFMVEKTASRNESGKQNFDETLSCLVESRTEDLQALTHKLGGITGKEVIESQLRKLQVENSSLQTENKLLKEKYNRSQSRVLSLESQLATLQREADTLQDEMSDEMNTLKRRSRDRSEKDRQEMSDQIFSLTKQLEVIKADNASLVKQLEAARQSADMSRLTLDKAHYGSGYRAEIAAVKAELEKLSHLLSESERSLREEVDRHKETSAALVRLTEVKNLLQQQLDTGGSSVAEKQLKSVERRLQITEERLTQERADRAGKLCEVEEKLLNDNARLQVAEKDLKRQLNREKDRHKAMETKYREMRAENEKLRVIMAEKPAIISHNKKSSHTITNGVCDSSDHMIRIKQEEGLADKQEEEVIMLLWQQKTEALSLLKDWELHMDDLNVNKDNISQSLKKLREDKLMCESRVREAEEKLSDSHKLREQMEVMLKGQVKDLLNEKHGAVAQLRGLEDLNAAMSAENESLRSTLQVSTTVSGRSNDSHSWEVQVESLKSELFSCRMESQQNTRRCAQLESEVESLRSQLMAKDLSLKEVQAELDSRPSVDRNKVIDEQNHMKIENLNGELKGAQSEVRHWREKYSQLQREYADLEEQLAVVSKKLARAKLNSSENFSESPLSESEKLALESELHEKDTQVLRLTIQYNEVENELQRTKQLLLLQQEHNEELSGQLEQLQTQLRQKTRLVEKMAMTESDHKVELQAVRENLAQVNKELSHKSNELKVRLLELERERHRMLQLEESVRARDSLLSQSIVDALADGRIKSALWAPGSETERSVSQIESRVRQLESDKELLSQELQKANMCIESMAGESSELLSQLRELRQELVTERAQVCQLTSDKMDTLQQLHIVTEEKDAYLKDKTRLEYDLARQETHTLHVIDSLESQAQKVSLDYKDKYRKLDEEGKQVLVDLSSTKRLLEAREKENEILRNTIEQQKTACQGLTRRLAVTNEEQATIANNNQELNNKIVTMMKETASLQSTIQQISSDKFQLQQERINLEKSLSKEQTGIVKSTNQMQDLQSKLEIANEKQRLTEDALHAKESQLISLESKLEHNNYTLTQLEKDKVDLRMQVDKLTDEVRVLNLGKNSLEERLSNQKLNLHDEKSSRQQLLDELFETRRALEAIKHEYDLLHDKLEAEKQATVSLRLQQQTQNERVYRLENQLRAQELDYSKAESELTSKLESSSHEKDNLLHDIQELRSALHEKDASMSEIQEQSRGHVQVMESSFASEKVTLIEEKHRLSSELRRLREENETIKEELEKTTHLLETQTQETAAHNAEARIKELERLELLITQLQTKITDTSAIETTRSDIQKMMGEIMHCLHEHTQAQRAVDIHVRHSESDSIRNKLLTLESALSQEQAMHLVTRTQLSSLEDDNRRLRQQLQVARKRLACANESDSRSKSRMEEINEIIARSQTRAAQLLASGIYGDDPLKSLTPSENFLSTLPNLSHITRAITPPPPAAGAVNHDLNKSAPLMSSPDRVFLTEHS